MSFNESWQAAKSFLLLKWGLPNQVIWGNKAWLCKGLWSLNCEAIPRHYFLNRLITTNACNFLIALPRGLRDSCWDRSQSLGSEDTSLGPIYCSMEHLSNDGSTSEQRVNQGERKIRNQDFIRAAEGYMVRDDEWRTVLNLSEAFPVAIVAMDETNCISSCLSVILRARNGCPRVLPSRSSSNSRLINWWCFDMGKGESTWTVPSWESTSMQTSSMTKRYHLQGGLRHCLQEVGAEMRVLYRERGFPPSVLTYVCTVCTPP